MTFKEFFMAVQKAVNGIVVNLDPEPTIINGYQAFPESVDKGVYRYVVLPDNADTVYGGERVTGDILVESYAQSDEPEWAMELSDKSRTLFNGLEGVTQTGPPIPSPNEPAVEAASVVRVSLRFPFLFVYG